MKLTKDIKLKIGCSAYVDGPFDETLKILEKHNYRLISLEENAELRIQEGADVFVSQKGNWVREGLLYVQGEGRFITKNSPVLDDPKKATQAHTKKREFFISDNQVQKALENSVHVPYDVSEIPTNGFEDNEIARFCFGKNAKEYGLFLKEAGISSMFLWFNTEDYIKKQEKPYANQLWLCWLDFSSNLTGDAGLFYGSRSRGIK